MKSATNFQAEIANKIVNSWNQIITIGDTGNQRETRHFSPFNTFDKKTSIISHLCSYFPVNRNNKYNEVRIKSRKKKFLFVFCSVLFCRFLDFCPSITSMKNSPSMVICQRLIHIIFALCLNAKNWTLFVGPLLACYNYRLE